MLGRKPTFFGTLWTSFFDHQSGLRAGDLEPIHLLDGELGRFGLDELYEGEIFLHQDVDDLPVLAKVLHDVFLLDVGVQPADVDPWMHRKVLFVEVFVRNDPTFGFCKFGDDSLSVEAATIQLDHCFLGFRLCFVFLFRYPLPQRRTGPS